jgi:hypothetical protein
MFEFSGDLLDAAIRIHRFAFASGVVLTAFGTVLFEELGPGWQAVAAAAIAIVGGTITIIGGLVSVLFGIVYKKIQKVEEENCKLREEFADKHARLQKEMREGETALTLQLTADRGIREDHHNHNLLALSQIIMAMKTGNTDLLDPEILFKTIPRR